MLSAVEVFRNVKREGVRSSLRRYGRQARRRALGTNAKLLERYLGAAPVRLLHLGCGPHLIPNWLNADFDPVSTEVFELDITRRFPLADSVFDRVFSEHTIEHVPYVGGVNLVRESFRVLRPGGHIRISTPDLAFVVGLYASEGVSSAGATSRGPRNGPSRGHRSPPHRS